ncbi:hypothetical protein [Kineococcus terrestris]|uniref:hypothetical protein n=1 Tax=Kineococcus terrestris TaxID=2044856 RepID=UPI0034DB0A15
MTTTVPGSWDLLVRTPVGRIEARVTITGTAGALTGEAAGRWETVPLRDVRAEPDATGSSRVRWRQSITRPLRLDLEFDVVVTGDVLEGTSRAGRLPASRVTGRRAAGDGGDRADARPG